jgi:hypothetical protein
VKRRSRRRRRAGGNSGDEDWRFESMRLLSDISPGWLKVLLLVYGITFALYGLFPPKNFSDFSINLLAGIVEIAIGTFIVLVVVEEVIRRDKEEKLFIILHTSNVGIANFAHFILFISLSNFIPKIHDPSKKILMREKLENMPPSVIPNTDTLNAMWDAFKLWDELFFDKDTMNPKGDYPEVISIIYKDIKHPINYLRKINSKLESLLTTEEQLVTIYAFETASLFIENKIQDLSIQKNQNLMGQMHSLLGSSIHMYSMSLNYLESVPPVEVVEIYKHGFKFTIKKMKWWL